jgi:hypothetical protein
MKKTEDELEKIERKYHTATKDVELLRQACDAEMYRVNIYRNYFFFDIIIVYLVRVAINYNKWN